MEAMRSTWTDSRLDDLNDRVKSMDRKIDEGFARLDGRIDTLNHTMIQGMIALISIITVLLAAFLTLVATRL
ncbi:MAG: hypothetical protein JST08_08615 [Actinobacteria bacterium]|nr:hypothetical protein [Actinomycetota bacterium]